MKKVAALVLVMCFASTATAGTAVFEVIGSNEIVIGSGGTVQFLISVNVDSLDAFDSTGIVAGANELSVDSFVFAQSWLDAALIAPPPAVSTGGLYPSDLFFGGLLVAPTQGALVGTLTVGAAGLEEGFYDVVINSDNDFGTSSLKLGTATDGGLFGIGTVNVVVPEPATLILLGIGGIAAMRRRRR